MWRIRIDVAVMAFGVDKALVRQLNEARVFVFVMVGSEVQARQAIAWGADGLIAQGCEAGGHLAGETSAAEFLPRALVIADGRPVLLAGGIATADDTRAALAAGASGVVAGTRFLLTHEARAHPVYQRRILAADKGVIAVAADQLPILQRGHRHVAVEADDELAWLDRIQLLGQRLRDGRERE